MHPSSPPAGRTRASIKQWLHERIEECVHCCECERSVSPWDTHCPNCGQESPARVSPSAAVYLVVAFAVLTIVLCLMVRAF
ncbi:MAG: hypothetical protein DWQ37_07950 [Planctomycetota bacterium]|nr:MAG: hypothetical protein DWQ37_07950 [Planctomycetota bacterium]